MKKIDTPTDFFIEAMDQLDDVSIVLVVRRHLDGSISLDTNTHSLWDTYALASAAQSIALGQVVVKEARGLDKGTLE